MMKDIFKTNWFLVVISILSAIIIWIYVVYQVNPMYETTIRNVPVNFTKQSKEFSSGKLALLSTSSETVDIKIRGKRSTVSKINRNSINCNVNMSEITSEGAYTLPFGINFNVDGIEVLSKAPYNITINVDDVITKELDINIDTTGTPAEGFIAESVEYTPLKIRLTGAQTIVKKVKDAKILVDLKNATDTVSGRYKVKLYDKNGQEFEDERIKKNITYTELKYNIFQTKDTEISATLSSDKNSRGQIVKVDKIKPASLTVIGDKRELLNIDKILTEEINVRYIKDGDTITVKIEDLPENTRLEKEVTEVEVTFKVVDEE